MSAWRIIRHLDSIQVYTVGISDTEKVATVGNSDTRLFSEAGNWQYSNGCLNMGPTKTEAIGRFLKLHGHADLADMYTPNMEVQVNVAKGEGKRIEAGSFKEKSYLQYTNGVETWKPFRIPFNAGGEATYTDSVLGFSLERHAEGIGMTGWDWKNKCSRWVAFDFDAMVGHSDQHSKKLNDSELRQIVDVVASIPWVTVRRSTSGKGIHLYVYLPAVDTANHTEHAALARAVLSMLMGLTGYDFQGKVDTCGGNMWIWHRKMYSDFANGVKNNGLEVVKQGGMLRNVPGNWRDYLGVVTRRTSKSSPKIATEALTLFEELTERRSRVDVDDEHKALVNWLANNNCVWWWDSDRSMLVTHTTHLRDAHKELKMKGDYKTVSTGAEHGVDHNCFCFPLRDGSWAVRRFSPGTAEADTWQQDGKGWTRCFLNRTPDLATLCLTHHGVELERGGYQFRQTDFAVKVLLALRIDLTIPTFLLARKAILKPGRATVQNKLIIKIERDENDSQDQLQGWSEDKDWWVRVIHSEVPLETEEEKDTDYDDMIRHIVSNTGDAGWVLRNQQSWITEPLQHVKHVLTALGHNPKEAGMLTGSLVMRSWEIVNMPFRAEYPGGRKWNRNAVQLAVLPTIDVDDLQYPSWQAILDHCGEGLDSAVVANEWCRNVGITKGSEFLMVWIASLFQRPEVPTTYLAFWGPQDSGKSIFHEAISQILLTKGVIRADTALKSASNFNAELVDAILCVVEETDLREDKRAYNKIKDWVTSPEIMFHVKGKTPFMAKNYTHWIQCSNDEEACPIFADDTRITLTYVSSLKTVIPKMQFMERLRKEAPDFLAAVLQIELPESNSRLGVPTIDTVTKHRAAEKNMTLLEEFLSKKVKYARGHLVASEDFYQAMQSWLDPMDRAHWSKQRIGRYLPSIHPKGRVGSNQATQYGNMSLDLDAEHKGFQYVAPLTGQFLKEE